VSSGQLTQTQATQLQQQISNQGAMFLFGELGRMIDGAGRQIPSSVQQAGQGALLRALGGISLSQFQQAEQSGQTLTQVAQAHGATQQAVQTAVLNAVQAALTQAQQQGQITSAQEQSLRSMLQNSSNNGWLFLIGGLGPGPQGPPPPAPTQTVTQ
jgi:hypothetical protein